MELDADEVLFVDEYLKTFRAGKAYKKLHPDVTQGSANTLGSRLLKKVETSEYFQLSIKERCATRQEIEVILSEMAKKKNIRALTLLAKYHGMVVDKVDIRYSWADFISSDDSEASIG